jgi:phage terminase large subunit-like protein
MTSTTLATADLNVSMTLSQLEQAIQTWPVKDRERALIEYNARVKGDRQIWFCESPGRDCDGRPHEGVPYPHARADQWPPPTFTWLVWLIMSGRGAGKTRTGAEWVRTISARVPRIAMVGRRGKDVRLTMVEGESGLEAVCQKAGIMYDWKPSTSEFTFENGCLALGFSAEEPDSLRGQQFGAAWLDEPAHMDLIDEVWSNLTLGLRLKGYPGGAKILCTSTPLPIKWLKDLIKAEGTSLTRVSTYANIDNLDGAFRANVLAPLEGTRKGRQEIEGQLLEDVPGALWQDKLFKRVNYKDRGIDWLDVFDRIVVAIDPAGTNNRRSDETGIVTVGRIGRYAVVLDDRSGKYSPNEWAAAAFSAYAAFDADAIVAEKNFGGDMVKSTLESHMEKTGQSARIIVKTASRSKQLRAEPVVALYEQGRVEHLPGLADLEQEQLTWVPGKGDSPNRIDALVWAVDELIKTAGQASIADAPSERLRQAQPGEATRALEPTVTTELPPGMGLPDDFPMRRMIA